MTSSLKKFDRLSNLENANHFQNNSVSHSLIYVISQYKLSVTNLAISYVKNQTRKSSAQHKFGKQIKFNSTADQSQSKFRRHSLQRKKYNYRIQSDQSQSLITKFKYNQELSELTKLSHSYQRERNENSSLKSMKRQALIRPQKSYYITQPFKIEDRIQNKLAEIKVEKKNKQKIIKEKQTIHIQQNSIQNISNCEPKPQTHNIDGKKIDEKTKQLVLKIENAQKYPKTYPKTSSYTSRSQYNIQKLKKKLDSYIQKHINQ